MDDTNKKDIVNVIFGGATAIYIDNELQIFRSGVHYHIEIVDYLLRNMHLNFNPIQTIKISDYSLYWETEPNFGQKDWYPDLDLNVLKSKLDMEHDKVY